MTIDACELTINVLYRWNPELFTIVQKKASLFFLPWRYGLSWSTTHRSCFLSRNITKIAETHPPAMRDVVIEQSPIWNYVNMKLTKFLPRKHLKSTALTVEKRSEISSKLLIKIPKRRQWFRLSVFIVNFLVFLLLTFFFCLRFLSRPFTNHRTAGEGGGHFFNSSLHFHQLHRHLDISRAITAGSLPLHIGSIRTRIGNFSLRAQDADH